MPESRPRIETDPDRAAAIRDLALSIGEDNSKALGFSQTDLVNHYRRRVAMGLYQLRDIINQVIEEDTLESNVR